MTQLFARRLRNILIRERLNPADVPAVSVVATRTRLPSPTGFPGNEPTLRNLLRLSTTLKTSPLYFLFFFSLLRKFD